MGGNVTTNQISHIPFGGQGLDIQSLVGLVRKEMKLIMVDRVVRRYCTLGY